MTTDTYKKGQLHRMLQIPQDVKIPFTLLEKIRTADIGTTVDNPTKIGKPKVKVTKLLKQRAVRALTWKRIGQKAKGTTNAKQGNIHDLKFSVFQNRITTPTLLFRDQAGNTLWCKYIKTRNTLQVFGKNAEGRLLDERSVAIVMERAGYYDSSTGYLVEPTSERGAYMMDYASNHPAGRY